MQECNKKSIKNYTHKEKVTWHVLFPCISPVGEEEKVKTISLESDFDLKLVSIRHEICFTT